MIEAGGAVVDRDVATGGFLGLGELDLLGMQLEHRVVEEPGQGDGSDLVRDRGKGGVDVGDHVGRRAKDGLGDPAGPPRLDVAGEHAA